MTLRTPTAAAALTVSALLVASACGPRHERAPLEPMGRLPGLVTTAEPEWIPFQISAGASLPDDPREPRLSDVRGVPVGGRARRVAWAPDGEALLVEVVPDGGPCEEAWLVPLGRGEPKRVSGAGARARIGAFVGPERVLVAESTCGDGAAPWQLVDVDVTSNARRVVARPQGEVLGVASDGGSAFYGVRAAGAGKPGRVERVALAGGAPTTLADCSALVGGAAAARSSVVFSCSDRDTAAIHLTSDEGSAARPWGGGGTYDFDATLSSDGRRMVFASSRAASRDAKKSDGPFQLYLATLDADERGSHAERLTFTGSSNVAPALGPSGRIAWLSDRGAPGAPPGVVVARFEAP